MLQVDHLANTTSPLPQSAGLQIQETVLPADYHATQRNVPSRDPDRLYICSRQRQEQFNGHVQSHVTTPLPWESQPIQVEGTIIQQPATMQIQVVQIASTISPHTEAEGSYSTHGSSGRSGIDRASNLIFLFLGTSQSTLKYGTQHGGPRIRHSRQKLRRRPGPSLTFSKRLPAPAPTKRRFRSRVTTGVGIHRLHSIGLIIHVVSEGPER